MKIFKYCKYVFERMKKITHFIKRIILVLANTINSFLPPTRMFKIKRLFYNWSGCNLDINVKMVGSSKIHFSNIEIKTGTWVGANVNFYCSRQGRITIGKNNDIAPNVLINTGTHEIGTAQKRAGLDRGHDITIGNGCWIGMGALILSGTTVGNGCIIAAGAVVRGDFPDNVMIAGVPAVIKKELK
jgi:maltose O-acetyltransferase